MSGSGAKPAAQVSQSIANLRVQSSITGSCRPILYGRPRVSVNLLAYYDFVAIPHTTSTGGGGKGGAGGTKTEQTDFSYQAAVVLGVCEGPQRSIIRGWRGKLIFGSVNVNSLNGLATEFVTVGVNTGNYTVADASVYKANVDVVYVGTAPISGFVNPGATLLNGPNLHYTQDRFGNYNFATPFRGVPLQIRYLVSDPSAQPSALPGMGLSFVPGYEGQPAWPYLTSRHRTEAIGYSGVCYLDASAYDLGTDAEVGNHNFEVSTFTEFSPSIPDANPAVIVRDFLINGSYGVRWPLQALDDLSAFGNYCVAAGLFLSPTLDNQRAAADWIRYLVDLINCDVIWSEGKLKFIPLGDGPVAANGASFAPNVTPQYDLTVDHFITSAGDPPITVSRISPTDVYNHVRLEFYNRADNYNTDIAEWKDAADIDQRGLRTKDVIEGHAFCDKAIAQMAVTLLGQKQLAIRATYSFTLPWTFARLEPLDLVTLTEPELGLFRWPVRINSIEETDTGSFTIEAEDAPIGMANAPAYGLQSNDGYSHDFNMAPGSVLTPFFFEPPIEQTTTGLEVWAAATGPDANWGGCLVWASLDSVEFKQVGRIVGGARYGTLTAALGTSSSDTLNLQLAGKGGQILPASAVDAASDASLLFVGDASGGEFIDYQGAALTGSQQYALTPLLRGRFGSLVSGLAAGATVVRVDDAIAKSDPLPLSMVGAQIFFKFTSFNVYGGGVESLADVTLYGYNITGSMLKLPPSDVTGMAARFEGFGIRIQWTPIADQDLADYEIRADGASWETANFLTRINGTNYLWAVQAYAGNRNLWVKARDLYGNYSLHAATVVLSVPAPVVTGLAVVISGPNIQLNWAGVAGAFALDHFLISRGPNMASQTVVAGPLSSRFELRADFIGTQVFGVAAVDVAGNVGAFVYAQVDIVAPSVPIPGNAGHQSQEVIDNNVLLYWQPPTSGTLPIDHYDIRRGVSFAAGTPLGSNGNSTFAAIFEQQSGTFSYWIAAVDTASNTGPALQVTAIVNQPPDFILRSSIDSAFGGTLTGMYLEGGKIYGPSFGETWDVHFTGRGWSSPQSQIAAGSPLYFEPSATSGSYEEVFDYGAVLTGTTITATVVANQVFGAVGVAVLISYKAALGDPWTDATAGATAVFATNFRYAKVRIDFTASGGDDLVEVAALNVKLSTKIRTDSGSAYASASDSGGTLVNFNLVFIDADTPQIQPNGTTAIIAVCNFVDAPYPTSFRVLLFDTTGARVSAPFSWTVRGS